MNIELRDKAFSDIIEFIRENHPEEIDKAYEIFWEEDYPEDFLGSSALDLGFINFEDWLICDYRDCDGKNFIDTYLTSVTPDADTLAMIEAMRNSVISLYSVIGSGDTLRLKDMILGDETEFTPNPIDGIKEGDVFATRILDIAGDKVLGRCVYPFSIKLLPDIKKHVEKQYKRYINNKCPEGNERRFLKDEAYLFNVIWVSNLFRPKQI